MEVQKNGLPRFFEKLEASIAEMSFVKLALGGRKNKSDDLLKVMARIIETKKGLRLSFTYHHKTKDIEKNYSFSEGVELVKKLLEESFENCDLFTSAEDIHLVFKNSSVKLTTSQPTFKSAPILQHNLPKNHLVNPENNIYLRELGVTDSAWQVKKTMNDKFRQINKFIEIIDSLLKESACGKSISFADMGCGKGYLTFALYDYLTNVMKINVKAEGIEFRKELVENCNKIKDKAGFSNLIFKSGTIESANIDKIDMLIALHACDTATDEAIFKGIKSGAEIIVCAPCCHKQIRKEMNTDNHLISFLKHGILAERQAEIITDGLRALIMEYFGYRTKVFEFISNEHTAKNVMITGTKSGKTEKKNEILEKIKEIKNFYGIRFHHLEKLLDLKI